MTEASRRTGLTIGTYSLVIDCLTNKREVLDSIPNKGKQGRRGRSGERERRERKRKCKISWQRVFVRTLKPQATKKYTNTGAVGGRQFSLAS